MRRDPTVHVGWAAGHLYVWGVFAGTIDRAIRRVGSVLAAARVAAGSDPLLGEVAGSVLPDGTASVRGWVPVSREMSGRATVGARLEAREQGLRVMSGA